MPVIFITGPTAIGKSELALKIAKKFNGEIINSDSMQVYKELKILSARPSIEDQKKINHHLYGHITGSNRYNVSKWCEDIIPIIKKNKKNNILSIIVGGTGLYIQTLLEGMASIPNFSEEYKKKSNDLLLNLGLEKFYKEVYKIDSESCKKISKNDTQRLKRIWEVYHATGKTLNQWIEKNHKTFFNNYDYKIFLFIPEREKIYKKVNNRFSKMINIGAIKEVKKLNSLNFELSLPIMKAHGVPEISKYLNGSINLNECILKGQQVTRNYVKRQITWWKASKLNNIEQFHDFPSKITLKSLIF